MNKTTSLEVEIKVTVREKVSDYSSAVAIEEHATVKCSPADIGQILSERASQQRMNILTRITERIESAKKKDEPTVDEALAKALK